MFLDFPSAQREATRLDVELNARYSLCNQNTNNIKENMFYA